MAHIATPIYRNFLMESLRRDDQWVYPVGNRYVRTPTTPPRPLVGSFRSARKQLLVVSCWLGPKSVGSFLHSIHPSPSTSSLLSVGSFRIRLPIIEPLRLRGAPECFRAIGTRSTSG